MVKIKAFKVRNIALQVSETGNPHIFWPANHCAFAQVHVDRCVGAGASAISTTKISIYQEILVYQIFKYIGINSYQYTTLHSFSISVHSVASKKFCASNRYCRHMQAWMQGRTQKQIRVQFTKGNINSPLFFVSTPMPKL